MSEQKKLYRKIADSIAAEIHAGIYKPGQRLPTERELALKFGVSRPSLREALIALEMMGLVEAKQGLGITVTDITEETPLDLEIGAFELIEARRLFEGEIAALSATLISEEQLSELQSLLDQMGDKDQAKAEKADREFHRLIAQSTGNGALIASVENLWDWRYQSPFAKSIMARAADLGMKDRIAEHTNILTAIRNRSPSAARLAMQEHMDRVVDHLLKATEIVAVENAKKAATARRLEISNRLQAIAKKA